MPILIENNDGDPLHIVSAKTFMRHAEQVAADAKHLADRSRIDYVRLMLAHAFPGYETAVFRRAWDENDPTLLRIESSAEPSITTDGDDSDLSADRTHAIFEAEHRVRLVHAGIDDNLAAHLDENEHSHGEWIEHALPLHPSH
jgi:hypothetical protein